MPLNSKVKCIQRWDCLELLSIGMYLGYQFCIKPEIMQKNKFIGFALVGSGAYFSQYYKNRQAFKDFYSSTDPKAYDALMKTYLQTLAYKSLILATYISFSFPCICPQDSEACTTQLLTNTLIVGLWTIFSRLVECICYCTMSIQKQEFQLGVHE